MVCARDVESTFIRYQTNTTCALQKKTTNECSPILIMVLLFSVSQYRLHASLFSCVSPQKLDGFVQNLAGGWEWGKSDPIKFWGKSFKGSQRRGGKPFFVMITTRQLDTLLYIFPRYLGGTHKSLSA